MSVTMYSDLASWKAAVGSGWSRTQTLGTDGAMASTKTLSDGTALSFATAMQVKTVPSSWATWSGGYTGQVYYSFGQISVVWTISNSGNGFGIYLESFDEVPFNCTLATNNGGSLTQNVDGNGGAKFFGWAGSGVTSMTLSCDEDFAAGDMYSLPATPSDVSCCEDPVVVDADVVTLLSQRQLRVAHLVQFDFLTTPKYLWNGFRDLATGGSGGDHTWQGLRNLGGIEGLEESADLTASQMKFTLSGVNAAILALAIGEDRDEYVGRLVTVWLQFFDANWQNVGDPIARACGIMDGLEISRARDGDGGSVRTLTLTAENIFYGRGVPPAGNYTDADQQFRFPGDRGLQFVNEVQNTVIQVPW